MAKGVQTEGWPTKAEAMALTGLSMRSIERAIEDGTIHREYRKQPGKRSVAVLHPEDVERLRHEATPVGPLVLPPQPNGEGVPALRNDPVTRTIASFLSLALPHVTQERKRFLTLPEAAHYVGLPEAYLRRCIKGGSLPTVRAGRLYVRRADLDQL
jgi:excisionase family DNA binding protein